MSNSPYPDGCTPADIDREMDDNDIDPPIYDGLRCPHCNEIQTAEDEEHQVCSTCGKDWD